MTDPPAKAENGIGRAPVLASYEWFVASIDAFWSYGFPVRPVGGTDTSASRPNTNLPVMAGDAASSPAMNDCSDGPWTPPPATEPGCRGCCVCAIPARCYFVDADFPVGGSPLTRQTLFPTSSATSSAPVLSMASPTGLPRA
jgi:hypothetical protein